jgi:hypothetical protein
MMRLEIIGWGKGSGRRARLQPCRRALIKSIQCGTKGEPQISPGNVFRQSVAEWRSAVLSNLHVRAEGRWNLWPISGDW